VAAVTGAFTEDPRLPEPDPDVLARHEAEIARLMAEREERIAQWEQVEQRVDEAHEERGRRHEPGS
jgi:hypothetical protein